MLHAGALNAELVNTESLLLEETQVRSLQDSGYVIFIKWSTHNLALCVFLLEYTLLSIQGYSWFINIELTPIAL